MRTDVLTTSQKIEIAQVITGRDHRQRLADDGRDLVRVRSIELPRRHCAVEGRRKRNSDAGDAAVSIDAIRAAEQRFDRLRRLQRNADRQLAASSSSSI